MPRTTHPEYDQRHDRGQLRSQRSRIIRKRWRLKKDLYRVDEGSGALVLDMDNKRVRATCSEATLRELSIELAQGGPLLFLHPESLRRLPPNLRATVEKCLGVRVSANELASDHLAHDKVLAAAVHSHHDQRPKKGRAREKRRWRREAEVEGLST